MFRFFYFGEVQISAFYAKITAEGTHWPYVWFVLQELRIVYPIALAIPAALLLRHMQQQAHFSLLVALSLMGIFFAGSNFDFNPTSASTRSPYPSFICCLPARATRSASFPGARLAP